MGLFYKDNNDKNSLLNCANCGARVEGWAATDSHCPNGCISTLTKDPEFDYRTKDNYKSQNKQIEEKKDDINYKKLAKELLNLMKQNEN